jgi:nucleoside-diphosphate-sugar epimerase
MLVASLPHKHSVDKLRGRGNLAVLVVGGAGYIGSHAAHVPRRKGIRPEKAGSNPSDTVRGIDGVPLEVKDIDRDIRIVAKHCKAADQQ